MEEAERGNNGHEARGRAGRIIARLKPWRTAVALKNFKPISGSAVQEVINQREGDT
jgi:hypothetical protein